MNAELRPELTPMPIRIHMLPRHRGYPVPWFVAWVNGEPEFRTADARKWEMAVTSKLCWVCGRQMGAFLAFVLGPMCGITRTTSEPACHRECAEWSIRNCPFLTRPHMSRREADLPAEAVEAPGCPIDRNPGVTLLWITRNFKVFPDGAGRYLIRVGDPEEIEFYAEGRTAMRGEIDESISTGLPLLLKATETDDEEGRRELAKAIKEFERHLPQQGVSLGG